MKLRLRILAGLLALTLAPALAQPRPGAVTPTQLQRFGINTRTFSTLNFIEESQTLIGFDVPNFTIKKKGVMVRVWAIPFDDSMKALKPRSYELRFPKLEQSALTPDHKSLICVSRRGTEVDRLDFADGRLTTIMSHVSGQPGFRLEPLIVSSSEGKLYTMGTYYDAQDFGTSKFYVELDPAATGPSAFHQLFDLRAIEDPLKPLKVMSELSPRGMFFFRSVGTDWVLTRWTPTGTRDVEHFKRYLGSWGEQTRVLYSSEKLDGTFQLAWADAVTGETRVLSSGPKMFYPVMSKDGSAYACESEPTPGDVKVHVAQDRDGYALKQVLDHRERSTMRFSESGKTLVLYNGVNGITLLRLP